MSNLKFYVPSCAMCPAMKKVGPVGHEIRYCTGFPGKKQKRLPKNSLKKGVASWCPKQISPPACRVLGFVDEDTAMLEYMLNSEKYAAGQDVAFPSVWHYKHCYIDGVLDEDLRQYILVHIALTISKFPL